MMNKPSEISMKSIDPELVSSKREPTHNNNNNNNKPQFRPATDDTKPLLQDPILRSDPVEKEEAVLRLPPFPPISS
ncbi:hypothetical protein M8C21_021804 [Ambrosia artemisiifolia]|uniref:Uncharacterized protein n=1 Tax=Ambrosia artemisiifolia TaxID=4212 RepID=A0AAD5BZS0_AMBAR|nr:hypothetical protein M8C21_021804 [Ambrosia artemisiifolia]